MKQLFIVISFSFCLVQTTNAGEPSLILAETGKYSQNWKDYRIKVIRGYKLEPELSQRAKTYFASPAYYDFSDPPEFDPLTALVYYMRADGSIRRYRVRAVDGKRAFDQFVRNELKRRGDGAEVDGSDFRVTLKAPPYRQKLKGPPGHPDVTVNREWQDFEIAYEDRLLTFGTGAHEAPLKPIARELRTARGKFWFMKYRPNTAPVQARNAFFAEIQKSAGVKFQQLDDESDSAYRMRRAIGEQALSLLRSLLFDVKEVVAWTKIPTDKDQFFTARFQLKAKAKSKLSSVLNQLPVSRGPVTTRHGETARFCINFAVPAEFVPALKTILANSNPSDTALGSAMAQELARGRIRVVASLRDLSGHPVLVAVTKSRPLAKVVENAASFFDAKSVEDRWFQTSAKAQFRQVSVPLRVSFSKVNDNVWLNIATSENNGVIRPAELIETERRPASTLISIDLDCGHWIAEGAEHPAFVLLQKIETIYSRTKPSTSFQQMRSRLRAQITGTSAAAEAHRSFLERSNKEGDWTVKMTLRHTRDTLVADVRVGKALFDYVLIRNSFE